MPRLYRERGTAAKRHKGAKDTTLEDLRNLMSFVTWW
jgi:hypothetical protein